MKGIGKTIRRRRREAKTDYHARIRMLKSSQPRLVIRKTNRYIIVQLIESDIAQDKVIVGASSKDLLEHGWPTSLQGSLKSIPAAYLTGLLLAHKIKGRETIIDLGMQRNVKKGRLYAVVAGLVAGGVKVPHGEDVIPDNESMAENTKTREAFNNVKEKLAHGRKGN